MKNPRRVIEVGIVAEESAGQRFCSVKGGEGEREGRKLVQVFSHMTEW